MAVFLQPRPNPRLQMINRNRSPMPAVKRPRSQHLQGSPTSKRHTAESVNDDSTEDNSIIKLLKKCSQKQKQIDIDKIPVENAIREQIEKYQKEMAVENKPDLYELFEKKLNDALQQATVYKRNDEEMATLPKLAKNDLDNIEWPVGLIEWSCYSKYRNSDVEGAAECRNLNEKIQILVENVEKTLKDSKTAQAQKANYKIRDLEYSLF
ncbi:hypothetical protein CAEBREN_11716 [Caenorhabditis brenneri]|uniref:Uncharacterized protein n=1 Tax=Caenorhabditis brenneri TaxID=135651 RepID=G0PJ20_CAEBE|nr:hypothetical protein CAEBREN_11716 [Caenorhabditis brenneri]